MHVERDKHKTQIPNPNNTLNLNSPPMPDHTHRLSNIMAAADHHHHSRHNSNNQERQFLRQVDPTIWRACAGAFVQIPAVHSRVYYFPQGHMEHSSNPLCLPSSSLRLASKPSIPCRVLNVLYLANPNTDEVYAKIRLEPLTAPANNDFLLESSRVVIGNRLNEEAEGNHQQNSVVSHVKVLTQSDANNGGGFSVPRFCADSIFPSLDYTADPPVQTIKIKDVHGDSWDFRHIYRGTPRRHLLTTGWSKFVNHKKLIAGDSVVFIKNRTSEELFVGVRRTVKSNGAVELVRWAPHYASLGSPGTGRGVNVEEAVGGGFRGEAERDGVFSRNGKGKVSPESVMEAADLAVKGLPFEVVYYPKMGSPDFVVATEKVVGALNVYWSPGMRVKMAMETEDSSRVTWFQGTVSSVVIPDNGLWRGSPWRMLQVAWDEPDALQNVKRVSPWEVEYIAPTPPLHTHFPPTKKFKVPHSSGLLTNGDAEFPLPTIGFGNSMIGHISSAHLNYNTFPAGMQGARQDPFNVSISHQVYADECFDNNTAEKVDAVSTEPNIGNVQFFGTDITRIGACNSSAKAGVTSFQLFGKIIHMEQPLGNTKDVGCAEYDGNKGFKEVKDIRNPLDLSLSDPCKKLVEGLDVQCQRASVVEAYSLRAAQ
ncbi:hypothetical protein Ancab_038237 [Ancistrocladus abbreviatus]